MTLKRWWRVDFQRESVFRGSLFSKGVCFQRESVFRGSLFRKDSVFRESAWFHKVLDSTFLKDFLEFSKCRTADIRSFRFSSLGLLTIKRLSCFKILLSEPGDWLRQLLSEPGDWLRQLLSEVGDWLKQSTLRKFKLYTFRRFFSTCVLDRLTEERLYKSAAEILWVMTESGVLIAWPFSDHVTGVVSSASLEGAPSFFQPFVQKSFIWSFKVWTRLEPVTP